jgi:hypothetical protein
MSTISSTQEAYEALCNGELFQIGGRYINPADIVEVDLNGGQNPIFYLRDGRTVQHDKFKRGDTGDLLADALQYATRGQAQAQFIQPPPFVETVLTPDFNSKIKALDGTNLGSETGVVNSTGFREFIPAQGEPFYFLIQNDAPYDILKFNVSDHSQAFKNTGIPGRGAGSHCYNSNTNRVYIADGLNNQVTVLDGADGTVITTKSTSDITVVRAFESDGRIAYKSDGITVADKNGQTNATGVPYASSTQMTDSTELDITEDGGYIVDANADDSEGGLTKVSTSDPGTIIWRFTGRFDTVGIDDEAGLVYGKDLNENVYGVDLETGKEVFRVTSLQSQQGSSLTGPSTHVVGEEYLGVARGYTDFVIYVVTRDGELKWSQDANAGTKMKAIEGRPSV